MKTTNESIKAAKEALQELKEEAEETEPNEKSEDLLDVLVQGAMHEEANAGDDLTPVAVATPANGKSQQMIHLIQAIDRKIPLDDYAEQNQLDFDEMLFQLEHLIKRGTKLDIQYFIDEVLEKDCQDELFDYFDEVDGDLNKAIDEFDGIYQPEEVRLARLVWKK